MLESTLSLVSLWTSMNSWLTPAVLFLLLNLMIGTIAVTSALSSSPKHHVNHHHHQQQQQPPPQIQTQLSRSPSVLQRLKSISFYPSYLNSTHHLHQHHHQQQHQQQSPVLLEPEPHHVHDAAPAPAPAPAAVVVEEEVHDEDEGPTLEEVFSKIVKKGNYGRQNSDTKPTGELPVPLPRKIFKKSATDKSVFAHFQTTATDHNADVAVAPLPPPPPPPVTVGGADADGVDEMADDFINRFRQNLRLQRLESLYGPNNK